MKSDYKKQLEGMAGFEEEGLQEEYAVLDKAGRLQIPRELLDEAGIEGNKVKIELNDGKIVLLPMEK